MARALLALGLAFAVLLSGCLTSNAPPPSGGNTTAPGGGSGSGGGAGGNATGGNATGGAVQDLAVSSAGQYPVNPGFAPTTLSAVAGRPIHVTFTNVDALPLVDHNWVLEGVTGAETDVVANGGSAEVTFGPLLPGEYPYFCSVGDHRARGMEGTLTVA